MVLVAFVASSVAQNFQPQFQPLNNGFQSQRVGPQGLTEGQREDVRAQEEFRKSAAIHKPKRLPNLDQPVRTLQQQPVQVIYVFDQTVDCYQERIRISEAS